MSDTKQDRRAAVLDRIRPLASAWHGSAEGLAWHRLQGKYRFTKRKSAEKVCSWCGKKFRTVNVSRARLCSNACSTADRKASGIDDVDRPCTVCGETFRINKYQRRKTCGPKCRAVQWRRTFDATPASLGSP